MPSHPARSKRKFAKSGLIGVFVLLALMLTTYSPTFAAESAPPDVVAPAQGDVGYVGPNYGTSGNSTPTGEKPESKLWWADGRWWAVMYNGSAAQYRIYWLNLSNQQWQDTGFATGNRGSDKVDVLWSESNQKLYMTSHVFSTSASASGAAPQLFRYSYNSGSKTFSLDSGFPVNVGVGRMEALVIDRDSTGRLWITYLQDRLPRVAHSTTNDQTWSAPFPIPGAQQTGSDDISSVIAFGGNKIGVVWSDQGHDAYYLAIHNDGAAPNTWTIETAIQGNGLVDDHISLATDNSGRLYLAGKTSLTGSNPLAILDIRQAAGGWSRSVFGMDADGHTRPIVLVDSQNQKIHMFATSPESGGAIYYKSANMGSNPSFPTGKGQVFANPAAGELNNPTSTKQQVNGATGLVVLASNNPTDTYHHNYLPLGGGPPPTTPPPTTPPPTTPPPTTPPPTTPPPTTPPPTTPPPGSQLTFSPVHDTYVKSESATKNYGTQEFVRVRGAASADHDAYFKFNVTGTGGSVQSATLRIYTYDGGPDGGTLYPASNTYLSSATPWTETGMTWNNAPGSQGSALANIGNAISHTWIELNVTAAITGDGTYSFMLTNGNSNSVFFHSREASDLRPELVIVTTGGSTTPPPTTPPPTTPPPTTPPPTTPPPTTPPPTTPPPGGLLEFAPIADTHVKTDRATSNYGTEPFVRLRKTSLNDYDSYFKFNVTGTGGSVQSATVWLYTYDGGPDGGSIYVASNNYLSSSAPWTESGLNWNNAPGVSGSPLDSAGSVTDNTWVSFDVTAAIAGDGTFSFALSNNDSNSVFYYSKEAANFRPRLEIDTGSAARNPSVGALSVPEVEFESEGFDTQELVTTPEPVVTTPAPVIYSLPFADDFALGTGWTASGAWQHDALAGLNSASAGWFANSAARGLDSTLQLNGLIDLTTVLSPTLTYQQKAILTAGDRVVVEVSGDGGQTWVAVSEESGAISEWAQRSVDLSAVSGQIVALRFRLDTTAELPAGTTSVGLWLDDVAVGLIEIPAPVVEPTDEPAPVTDTPATEVPPTVELPTEVPTDVPTEIPTSAPSVEPTSETPVVPPASGLLTVESDDLAVIASGLWTAHNTAEASGGRYVYSSGALTETLTLGFTGTQVDVVFVIHPALGSFAVEVDGAQLQIVSSTGDQAFGARTSITGLADGAHTLRIVPISGTIAIDAFAVAGLAPAAPVPPVVDPGLPPVVETPVVPTGEPTTLPQPDVTVPSVTPTATPLPVILPYFDAFEVEQTWVADGDWVYALNGGYLGSGWVGYANQRGAINTLTLAYQLDLRTAIAPQLTFWQMADLQGDELFSVEVSVDGGLSWLPIDLQPGWTGAWMQRTVDLTGFRGTVIGLRFALIAGPSNQNAANRPSMVAIDELAVQEYVAPTPTSLPTELPTQEPVTAPQVVTPEPTLLPTETPTQEPVVEPPLPPTEAPTVEVVPPPTEEPPQEPAPTEESAEGDAQ